MKELLEREQIVKRLNAALVIGQNKINTLESFLVILLIIGSFK